MRLPKFLLRLTAIGLVMLMTWTLVHSGREVAAALAPAPEHATKPVEMVVLMYHAVNSDAKRSGDYVITPEALRRDLNFLQKRGCNTIVMSQLIDFVHDGTPLPKNPVMITFDDGYYNNYLHVFPLLKEFGAKAVISIIGAESDKFSAIEENNQNYSHLTWPQINEMRDSGLVEFQNHSYNMHKTGGKARMGAARKTGETAEAYQAALTEDMQKLQERYTEMTGWTPNTYAYPFGRISKESYPVVTKLGFAASLDVQGRLYVATPGDEHCLFRIPRYNRTNSTGAEAIFASAFPKKKVK